MVFTRLPDSLSTALFLGSSALLLALCSPVAAQDEAPVPGLSEERRKDIAASIESALDVYLVHKPKREALEGVIVQRGRAEVWFLRNLDVNQQDAKCDALRWLLLGRFQTSKGVRAAFEANPEMETVALVFYRVETRVRVGARGEYVQDRTAVRTLEVSIDRTKGKVLNRKLLEAALRGNRDTCIAKGEAAVDHHWYIR